MVYYCFNHITFIVYDYVRVRSSYLDLADLA